MDDGDDASYDPMKDPLLKPRRTTDPGWNYGYMVTPGNSNIVKCNICGKVTQGGIKRHKEHLAGTGGDAIGCPGVSTEVRREMIAYLEKNRRNQPIDLDEVVEVDVVVDLIYVVEVDVVVDLIYVVDPYLEKNRRSQISVVETRNGGFVGSRTRKFKDDSSRMNCQTQDSDGKRVSRCNFRED